MNTLLSSGLLAASMMLGQTPDVPTPLKQVQPVQAKQIVTQTQVQPAAPPQMQPTRPILGWFQREDRPFMSRLQNFFRRDQGDPQKGNFRETPPPPIGTPVPPVTNTPAPVTPAPSIEFPRKLPNSSSKAPASPIKVVSQATEAEKSVQTTSLQEPALLNNTKSPIRAQFSEKIGRDEKFEWITGQLEVENNNYVIYYATPETVDKYQGRVILQAQQVDMKQFRRGDLISVRGGIAQRTTVQGVVGIYRVDQANLIERAK